MADRFPLIVDSTTQTIKELPSGDNLDLTGSSIVNASGIDVTGTVTADGLTVETAAGTSGTIALLRNSSSASNGNAAYLDFKFDNSFSGNNVDVQIGAIKTNAGNEESAFVVKTTEGAGTPVERFRAGANGDISFYEDTGTTPKFFWDASAESLGIGTSSPSKTLDIEGNIRAKNTEGSSGAEIDITSGSTWRFRSNATTGTNSYGLDIIKGSAGTDVKMSIDSSGKVGIGMTPASGHDLAVYDTTNTSFSLHNSTTGTADSDGFRLQAIGSDAYVVNNEAGNLRFYTSAAERMRIDASGNVGIGTSSPSALLNVAGASDDPVLLFTRTDNASGNGYVRSEGNTGTVNAEIQLGSGADDVIRFATNGGVATNERMRIDSNGNVGIGTDSPSEKLTISASNSGGANNNTLRFVDTDVTTEANQSFGKIEFETQDLNNAGVNAFINAFSEGTGGTGALSFGTGSAGSTERMRIDSSGRVGIGTSSIFADAKLQVETNSDSGVYNYFRNTNTGTSAASFINVLSSGADLRIGAYGSGHSTLANQATIFNHKLTGSLLFGTEGTERMRIDASGNLLVGTTTTPSLAGLAVGSTTTGKNISVFSSSNGNNGIIGVYQSSGTQEGQIYAGSGDINLFGTSVVKVVASSGGVQLTSGATSWTAISDERVKDIIEPITNAAQKVSSLRAVIGKYKTDTEETRRSFLIAQDVQAVLPEAVDATDEDNLGVRYTETIPLLVAAIQEQQAIIEALTARIEALES